MHAPCFGTQSEQSSKQLLLAKMKAFIFANIPQKLIYAYDFGLLFSTTAFYKNAVQKQDCFTKFHLNNIMSLSHMMILKAVG